MRTIIKLAVLALSAIPLSGAMADPVAVSVAGSHRITRNRPLSSVPSTVPRSWYGVALVEVNAHGGWDLNHVYGEKCSYSPNPPTFHNGSVTTGVVTAYGQDCGNPLPICRATGSATVFGSFYTGLFDTTAQAEDLFFAGLAPGPHDGAWASYWGDTWDPWPIGLDSLVPIDPDEPLFDFGFWLDERTCESTAGPDGQWSASYAAYLADGISTYEVDPFRAAMPELMYEVKFGLRGSGYWVEFIYGSPPTFPITFSLSEADAEARLLSALQNGWTGDLEVLTGTLDVRGHDQFTWGVHDHVEAAVPEPTGLAVLALGLMSLTRRRGRRSR